MENYSTGRSICQEGKGRFIPPPKVAGLLANFYTGILAMLGTTGCTIAQARQHIIDEYNQWIDYFAIGAGAAGLLSADFAADLRHNRDALAQVFGDGTVTLTS